MQFEFLPWGRDEARKRQKMGNFGAFMNHTCILTRDLKFWLYIVLGL